MELPSRQWSAETLQIGMDMVEQGKGIDTLDAKTELELQEELARLEAMAEMDAMKDLREEEVQAKPVATPARNEHSLPTTYDQPDAVHTPEDSTAGPFDETIPGVLGEVQNGEDDFSCEYPSPGAYDMSCLDTASDDDLAACLAMSFNDPAIEDPYGFHEKAEVAAAAESEKKDPGGKNIVNSENLAAGLGAAADPLAVNSADMKKIHRLMAPREDGSFLVPEAIVKLWKDVANGGRDEVKKLWLTVGGDKEHFVQKCKRRSESISENDLWVDGTYMSEKAMVDDGFEPSRILAIKNERKKHTGWIRRDRYEKHLHVYWVESQMAGRKKKRVTLVDEDEVDHADMVSSFDDFNPPDMELPEDSADPGQVVDADATNSQKTTLKAISFPLMDEPDALPSSYITKVLQAVAKWSCKMAALVESFQAVDEPNGNLKTLVARATEIETDLGKANDEITAIHTSGIVDGYKRGCQDKLTDLFKKCQSLCTQALNLGTRSQPFLAHIKAKQKKEIREREKNEQSSETPSRGAVKKERRNR